MNINKPIAQLARPSSLEELVLEESVQKCILEFIKSPELMPHLIFTGPPGTGKTSTARVVANSILKNTTSFNYKELNASMDRGVDVVRTEILSFVNNKSFFKIGSPEAPYKIVFLDEADMLTSEAQNALRNMLETYASNCRFILSCNMYEKIVPALKSRALCIRFNPLEYSVMLTKLQKVNEKYNLGYAKKKIQEACELSRGDFRIAYNYLSASNSINLPHAIQEFVKFIVHKSVDCPLPEVYQIITLKKDIIEESTKPFYKKLCEELVELPMTQIFLVLDRLAQAQAATYSGATEVVQFLGWYGYYRSLLI